MNDELLLPGLKIFGQGSRSVHTTRNAFEVFWLCKIIEKSVLLTNRSRVPPPLIPALLRITPDTLISHGDHLVLWP